LGSEVTLTVEVAHRNALLRKHEGFFAGLTFRLSAIVSALLHFDFRLFAALLSGEKVGSQAS
jgi:hypothetical protein